MPRTYLLTPALLLLISLVGVRLTPDVAYAGGNQPPVVTILAPANGDAFAVGATIQFSATAIDPETGPLGGTQMLWTDDIQPGFAIGTGTSFTRNNLIVGTHNVRLRATDPQGGQTSRTVTFTVGVATLTPTATATDTPTPTPTDTPTATDTPTPTPTDTPTSTPTDTPTPTPTATNTPTATPSATPVPPTATQTNTPIPPSATHTNTPVPPTLTPTPQPATASPTATPRAHGKRCADVTGDGAVRWDDFARIARQIRMPYDERYDINRDGRVDRHDLRAALWQLGRRCHQDLTPTPTKTPKPPKATKTPGDAAATTTPNPTQPPEHTATPTPLQD